MIGWNPPWSNWPRSEEEDSCSSTSAPPPDFQCPTAAPARPKSRTCTWWAAAGRTSPDRWKRSTQTAGRPIAAKFACSSANGCRKFPESPKNSFINQKSDSRRRLLPFLRSRSSPLWPCDSLCSSCSTLCFHREWRDRFGWIWRAFRRAKDCPCCRRSRAYSTESSRHCDS